MKIYLIISEVDYEGETIHAPAYLSEIAADHQLAKLKDGEADFAYDRMEVYEFEVDEDSPMCTRTACQHRTEEDKAQ